MAGISRPSDFLAGISKVPPLIFQHGDPSVAFTRAPARRADAPRTSRPVLPSSHSSRSPPFQNYRSSHREARETSAGWLGAWRARVRRVLPLVSEIPAGRRSGNRSTPPPSRIESLNSVRAAVTDLIQGVPRRQLMDHSLWNKPPRIAYLAVS